MKHNQTGKRHLLNYTVLAGLLLGSISAAALPGAAASDSENAICRAYDDIDKEFIAVLESYGYTEPVLTEAQVKAMEDELSLLDAEYEKIYNGESYDEAKLAELDKKVDIIYESYGYTEPVLTEAQEKAMEEKLSQINEKYLDIDPEEYFTPEQKAKIESLDIQYVKIMESFGFVEPKLNDAQQEEFDAEIDILDEEYTKIFKQFEDASPSEEAKIIEQLEEIDARINAVWTSYGYSDPDLTEDQYKELEAKIAPIEEQYFELYESLKCDTNHK